MASDALHITGNDEAALLVDFGQDRTEQYRWFRLHQQDDDPLAFLIVAIAV